MMLLLLLFPFATLIGLDIVAISPGRCALEATAVTVNALALPKLANTHLDHLRIFDIDTVERKPYCSTWISGLLELAESGPFNNAPKAHLSTEDVLVGIDYRVPATIVIGAALGYLNSYYHQHSFDHGHINSGYLAAYGNVSIKSFYLEPALWGVYNYATNKRTVINEIAYSHIKTLQLIPHLELGFNINRAKVVFNPFVALDYEYSWQPSFTETGDSPFIASTAKRTFSALRSEVGFKFAESWKFNWGLLFIKERAGFVGVQPFGASHTATIDSLNKTFIFQTDHTFIPLASIGLDMSASIGKLHPTGIRLSYSGEFGVRRMSTKFQILLSKIF